MPEDSGSKNKSPVLGLKGELWVFRKSQKISTASDQYLLNERNRVFATNSYFLISISLEFNVINLRYYKL